MARASATFRQQDVIRALRAAAVAGVNVQRVEIEPGGKIVLVTGRAADAEHAARIGAGALDGWRAARGQG